MKQAAPHIVLAAALALTLTNLLLFTKPWDRAAEPANQFEYAELLITSEDVYVGLPDAIVKNDSVEAHIETLKEQFGFDCRTSDLPIHFLNCFTRLGWQFTSLTSFSDGSTSYYFRRGAS